MPKTRRRRVLFVLLYLCLSAVAAQAQTGTITGMLVEDGTGIPLIGVPPVNVVTAFNATTGDTQGVSDATDTTGRYEIVVLPGTYYLKVTGASSHVRELHPDIVCIAVDCPLTAGTPVTVTAGATTTVDFSLAKSGTIGGTVRRADNNAPLFQVTVELYNASTSVIVPVPTSTPAGGYTFQGLAAGTYFARTVASTVPADLVSELHNGIPCPRGIPDTDCRIASGTPIVVTGGVVTSNVDFSLDTGAAIAGAVVADGTSTPIAGLAVTAYLGEIAMGGAITAQNGRYSIVGLPAGRYRVRTAVSTENLIDEWQNGVCVGCAGAIPTFTLGSGGAATGIDFSLATGATIAGSIACNTTALDQLGPGVLLFDSTGRLVKQQTRDPFTLLTNACRTGSPIAYTVRGLPPGSYYVLAKDLPLQPGGTRLNSGFFVDQLYGGVVCVAADCDVRKGTPIVVAAGATVNGVNITVQPGGGLVLPAEPSNPTYKVFDARGVELVDVIGVSFFGQLHPIVAGLPVGAYYVTKNGRLNGGSDCLDCPPTAGTPIVVGPGGFTTGQTTFSTTSRSVSGTITNAAGGAPLSTVGVELVSRGGQVVASALSNVLGRYSVTGLRPGTYFARTLNDRGFVDEAYMDAACGTCDPRVGTPIVVSSTTDVTGVDFVLAEGGVVSGVVSDTDGAVLGNVPVSVFAGTNTLAGVKTTSASGRYRTTIPAGTYRALAEATTGKGSEVYSEMPCTSAGCDPATGTAIPVTTSNVTDNINFTVGSCSAMSLSPSLLATAVAGISYRQVFSTVGGNGPYVFDTTDGRVPLGLTLNPSTGVLSGTPTAAGRSTFRVSALDANGCATDRSYVLDVQACAFTLSPGSATLSSAGGSVVITIANGCGTQDVVETVDWIAGDSSIAGQVTLTIAPNPQGTPRTAAVTIGRRAFEVRQAGVGSQAPFGLLELPAEGAQVSGAVAIGGWALDDLEVRRVAIFRDNVPGEPAGQIFIGNAVFIPGARPDVQQAAPIVPHSDRAGFGFVVLTNTLPNQGNGTFRLHAIAEDAEGHTTLLGSRTIVSNNATSQVPFGTIDTPTQGGIVAGASYVNFGWALTSQPGMIPTDGSTIQVVIDGVPLGNVNYNHFRPDVSNTFPGLANSAGPVGYRVIDTTALAEGLHTISWTVTDSRPATSGIGSRYFNVANSADAQPSGTGSVTATETDAAAADVATPLGAAAAPDMGRRAESLSIAIASARAAAPDVLVQRGEGPKRRVRVSDEGTSALTLAPMERIELTLGVTDDACPATWAGYLVKDSVLSDLPVGASLDPAGTFYWQTGPGFAGRFPLVFVQTNCRGEKQQTPVTVTIPNQ